VVTGLKGSDTVTGLSETYDNKNAGSGKTLSVSPSYTVNDGNGGLNYCSADIANCSVANGGTVKLVADNTGVINKANATIAVVGYDVIYDGNSHTATGTATGVQNEPLAGLNLTGTTHTNAGDHPNGPWTFSDVTGNYNAVPGNNNPPNTVHDSIHEVRLALGLTATPNPVTSGGTVVYNLTVTNTGVNPANALNV